jgi:hypothetical protein
MFRVARRLLSSDVTTVAQFTNVNSFKHMKAPRKVKEAFLIKPNLNYLKKLSLKNAGKDEKLDKLDTLAPSLTHIPSPLGQKDPIASVRTTGVYLCLSIAMNFLTLIFSCAFNRFTTQSTPFSSLPRLVVCLFKARLTMACLVWENLCWKHRT